MVGLPNVVYVLAGIVKSLVADDLQFLNPSLEVLLISDETFKHDIDDDNIGIMNPVSIQQIGLDIEEVSENFELSMRAYFSHSVQEISSFKHVLFINASLHVGDTSPEDLTDLLSTTFSNQAEYEMYGSAIFKHFITDSGLNIADAFTKETERIDKENPEDKEVQFTPFNSHFFKKEGEK